MRNNENTRFTLVQWYDGYWRKEINTEKRTEKQCDQKGRFQSEGR